MCQAPVCQAPGAHVPAGGIFLCGNGAGGLKSGYGCGSEPRGGAAGGSKGKQVQQACACRPIFCLAFPPPSRFGPSCRSRVLFVPCLVFCSSTRLIGPVTSSSARSQPLHGKTS
jgi:hypothetical protein